MNDVGPSRGFPKAVYTKQVFRRYAGNKFIEALPPLTDEKALTLGMWRKITVTEEERQQSSFLRHHMVATIHKCFMQPLTDHVFLATEVSAIMRAGYLGRDPSSPAFLRSIGLAVKAMRVAADHPNTEAGDGMALIGMSGVGKSTAIDSVLRFYPEVIWHRDLTGPLRTTHQVTYVKVVCPIDGSIMTVCRSFFLQLDAKLGTNYYYLYTRNATLEQMRDQMGILCFVHGVGLFIIDEVQNLVGAKGGSGQKLLNFFLGLRDALKVPVIAIGTHEALPVLSQSLRLARRHAGQRLFERMKQDSEFDLFCKGLFPAYYLRIPLDPTPEFRTELYELSQGITDVAIRLFELAQSRALADGEEIIRPDTLRIVYDESLHLLHEHLADIREGRQFDEHAWEAALRAVRNGNGAKRSASTTVKENESKASRPGALRTKRAAAGEIPPPREGTTSEAVPASRLVEAIDPSASGYEALKVAGFIRDLGAEVIRGD